MQLKMLSDCNISLVDTNQVRIPSVTNYQLIIIWSLAWNEASLHFFRVPRSYWSANPHQWQVLAKIRFLCRRLPLVWISSSMRLICQHRERLRWIKTTRTTWRKHDKTASSEFWVRSCAKVSFCAALHWGCTKRCTPSVCSSVCLSVVPCPCRNRNERWLDWMTYCVACQLSWPSVAVDCVKSE